MKKTADGDMTRLGFNVSLALQVAHKTRVNTLDKRIRRKPVTRNTDFYGRIKAKKLNINEHHVLDSKVSENGVKKCGKEYDEHSTNLSEDKRKPITSHVMP
jgi:hypothetical protein